jgi:hypothetical protein
MFCHYDNPIAHLTRLPISTPDDLTGERVAVLVYDR